MAVLSLAVPVVLLVICHGHQMSQVGILATALCSYVFLLQLCVCRSCSFYTDFRRISYGLLLSYFSAGQIGPRAAIVILHLTTAWAAAYLGYSLASHRLRMGTERAIIDGELPQPCHHSKDRAYRIASMIPVAAFIVTLIWTVSMTAIIFTNDITDEFDIVFLLSYVGWIHVAVWLLYVADVPMRKVLMKEPMVSLLASILPCLMISPVISAVCRILSILFQWLMMMTLVAILSYNLSVYVHYLLTAASYRVLLGKHDKSCEEKLNSMEHMGDHDENPKEMTATCNPIKEKALEVQQDRGLEIQQDMGKKALDNMEEYRCW
ncbi:hypothetical protein ACQJBY_063478 [Aegilops geniculata]